MSNRTTEGKTKRGRACYQVVHLFLCRSCVHVAFHCQEGGEAIAAEDGARRGEKEKTPGIHIVAWGVSMQ